jgi:hypothetical protein
LLRRLTDALFLALTDLSLFARRWISWNRRPLKANYDETILRLVSFSTDDPAAEMVSFARWPASLKGLNFLLVGIIE